MGITATPRSAGSKGPSDLGQSRRAPVGSEGDGDIERAALDSLAARVAIVDSSGNILSTNLKWLQDASPLLPRLRVAAGANLIDLWRRAAPQLPAAERARKGLRSVLQRQSPRFRMQVRSAGGSDIRVTTMTMTALKRAKGGAIICCWDSTKSWKTGRKVRALCSRLMTAHEEERRSIARELHDDVTPQLAASVIDLSLAAQRLCGENQAMVKGIVENLRRLCTNIHGLSRRMHPHSLQTLGLPRALEGECRAFAERTGLGVTTHISELQRPLPAPAALSAYRICQESLHNIEKHARATGVRVSLQHGGTELRLSIKDNGVGFEPAAGHCGIGLCGMRERATAVGGRVSITSGRGKGTTIQLTIPLGEKQA